MKNRGWGGVADKGSEVAFPKLHLKVAKGLVSILPCTGIQVCVRGRELLCLKKVPLHQSVHEGRARDGCVGDHRESYKDVFLGSGDKSSLGLESGFILQRAVSLTPASVDVEDS